jgi:hypothetical protein
VAESLAQRLADRKAAAHGSGGRPNSDRDSGIIRAETAASPTRATDQPNQEIRPSALGIMANCPNEPTALATPIAMLRRSGGTTWLTAARTTEKLVPLSASPMKMPAHRVSSNPVVE